MRYAPAIHYSRVTLIIATIPAFTALGRLSHASMMVRRSFGICDIHMTCSGRKTMSCECSDVLCSCVAHGGFAPPRAVFCGGCVVEVLRSCSSIKVEAAGIEPASESLQLQPLHMLFRGRNGTPPTSPVWQEGRLPGLSFASGSSRRGRMEAIPHRDALHHHCGRVMGGRWPGC
jgi:hypothetical protein